MERPEARREGIERLARKFVRRSNRCPAIVLFGMPISGRPDFQYAWTADVELFQCVYSAYGGQPTSTSSTVIVWAYTGRSTPTTWTCYVCKAADMLWCSTEPCGGWRRYSTNIGHFGSMAEIKCSYGPSCDGVTTACCIYSDW